MKLKIDIKKKRVTILLFAIICFIVLLPICFVILNGTRFFPSKFVRTGVSSVSKASVYDKTIIIDPGHGGVDSGAVGIGNLKEKTLNLTISLKLRTSLEKLGYKVITTRVDDRELYNSGAVSLYDKKYSDLKNRVSLTAKYPESIYISIHQNDDDDSSYNGTQVYYSTFYSDSKKLASDIDSAVKSGLEPNNKRRIVKDNNLYVLHHTQVPSVLVECGFISNKKDADNLLNANYQQKLVSAIDSGVNEFFSEVMVKK